MQSTGRDLLHFAYTWDDAYVATLTGRVASSSNVQKFIYYADTNNNGLMETGERVVVATWQGSNRNVDLFLGRYAASQPRGDPMVSPITGLGDGYRLPGQVTNLPSQGQPDYSGPWGTGDGLWMEWRIPWGDAPGQPGLGIAPGTAFTFHVSSTNSTPGAGSFPAQVDDNMAGCGGGPASTQYAGVLFDPDRSLGGSPGATVYASHVVVNTGNGADTFDLTYAPPTGTHSPTVAFYRDADRSGTFTPGDVLLTDTGGTGDPDTGSMARGDTLHVLIAYGIDSSASGAATVVSTAQSVYDTRFADTVTDMVTVHGPQLLITKAVRTVSDPVNGTAPNAKSIPGAWVDYTITVENWGSGTVDANSIRIDDPIPTGTQLFVGDLTGAGSGPVEFADGTPTSGLTYAFSGLSDPGDGLEFSDDNGASFTYVPVPDAGGFDSRVTTLRVRPGGVMNAAGGGNPRFSIRFRIAVR